MAAVSRLLVERLRLITSKPCSIDQRKPAMSKGLPPLPRAPSTAHARDRAVRSERTDDPAHAVPCPATSPTSSSSMPESTVPPADTTTARSRLPMSGCFASTPLSTMHTLAPAPAEPSQAHSEGYALGPVARERNGLRHWRARLHAGSGCTAPDTCVIVRGREREACIRRWGRRSDMLATCAPATSTRAPAKVAAEKKKCRRKNDPELLIELGRLPPGVRRL